MKAPAEPEVALTGGRVTAGVVRVKDTVRRPTGPHSPFVHQLLGHLEARGLGCVPRFLGMDAQGREVLSFIEGEVPSELGEFSELQLAAAARLLRRLHDASADCALRGTHEVVCHGDAGPCNSVFVSGVPVALIDFDAAHPGSRWQDVGYAAWLWLSIGDDRRSPGSQAGRLRAFVEAYGTLDPSGAVPAVLAVQADFATRPGVPPHVQSWAGACRQWVERHLAASNEG